MSPHIGTPPLVAVELEPEPSAEPVLPDDAVPVDPAVVADVPLDDALLDDAVLVAEALPLPSDPASPLPDPLLESPSSPQPIDNIASARPIKHLRYKPFI